MVLHLKKVSSKNSNQIKSYGTFKMGYKWRHLLPVHLVLEGFHEITAVSKGFVWPICQSSILVKKGAAISEDRGKVRFNLGQT